MEVAKEEEEATKELFQSKQKRMKESDYYDDINSDEEEEEEEVATVAAQLKRKAMKQRPLPTTTSNSSSLPVSYLYSNKLKQHRSKALYFSPPIFFALLCTLWCHAATTTCHIFNSFHYNITDLIGFLSL